MGFDVIGPRRRVRASNIDDGEEPLWDILAMPRELGLICPQIEKLNARFYESSTIAFAQGEVSALREELVRLASAYRKRREPELIAEHRVRAKELNVRDQIVEKLIQQDPQYVILEGLQVLCEEAIMAEVDVQCVGD